MRVLLAGATGAIGSRLVPQLLEAGHQVTGLTRREGSLEGTGAVELVGDILHRFPLLEAVSGLRFDAVIHQATHLAKAPMMYSHMWRTNRLRTEGTSNLLAVARATGAKKFVTASAFYGYGFSDFGDEPLDESEPFGLMSTRHLDPVHIALLSNEQQVRAFGGVALRYGLIYGTGGSPIVAGDWNGVLPMLHIVDAAAAAVRALEKGRAGAVYNIADDHPVSWRELQEGSAMAEGRRLPQAVPSWTIRTGAPFAAELLTRTSMRLSTVRAKRELAWHPRFPTFADGLRESVDLVARA